MAETVLELVIRCNTPADADWVLRMLQSSLAEHNGIQVDCAGTYPAEVYDAEIEVEGVPA